MGHEDINQDQRGWWFSRENDYFKADDATDCDKGFESSLGMIERTFQLHGPFDGIFAFSQGAALASLMCLMKQRTGSSRSNSLKNSFRSSRGLPSSRTRVDTSFPPRFTRSRATSGSFTRWPSSVLSRRRMKRTRRKLPSSRRQRAVPEMPSLKKRRRKRLKEPT